MSSRTNVVEEAARRATWQLGEVVRDIRAARHAAGLSQRAVAQALGCSPQLVSLLECRSVDPTPIQLARWAATVGLDVGVRTFPGGSPLRDAGQLQVLARFQSAVGAVWMWRTEVPPTADPRDRRAIDAVLSNGAVRIGAEAIVRLTDAQSQTRGAVAKQEAAELACMLLVLADSRHNRLALRDARPTIDPAFPLGHRETMKALAAGIAPRANGVVFV